MKISYCYQKKTDKAKLICSLVTSLTMLTRSQSPFNFRRIRRILFEVKRILLFRLEFWL